MLKVSHHPMEVVKVAHSSSDAKVCKNDYICDTPFKLNLGSMEEGFCVRR